MKVNHRMNANPRRRRRGVTLVEMLVTVAVLLLVMSLVVQIFQVATGAMSAAQITQRLDDELRRVDSTLRADLHGATARFTPPLDPKDNLGYFEYIENEFADDQGEDADDALRFTAKAPPGRPFTGRMWAKPPMVGHLIPTQGLIQTLTAVELNRYLTSQPITVTSEYAEIIYFLRNGNLYRRVLLVAPQLQSAIVGSISNTGYFLDASGAPADARQFTPAALGGSTTSWQGVNDLSARPASTGQATSGGVMNAVRLNSLGDLTDRHNRFASPRFADDFQDVAGGLTPDGVTDDLNRDNVPDWYPTLYPNVIESAFNATADTHGLWNVLVDAAVIRNSGLQQAMGFPYLYRGAFSQAQALGGDTQVGWIHAPAPFATTGDGSTVIAFNSNPVNYLASLNHNPLDQGDDLPTPFANSAPANNLQTYWGFPTWRETLAPEWTDPTHQVNQNGGYVFPFGLAPLTSTEVANGRIDPLGTQLLPPLVDYDGSGRAWRSAAEADRFSDGAGDSTLMFSGNHALWTDYSFEDDLLLKNVRSFDVKAYDASLADYADLGWGDDPRITPTATNNNSTRAYLGTGNNPTPYLYGNSTALPQTGGVPGARPNAYAMINDQARHLLNETFAHEGRMPPLLDDYRFDAQFGIQTYPGSHPRYTGNVGDDGPGVVRMRRIWDSWSTTYSKAPATGVDPATGFPVGPPFTPPIYPSYPAPYPAPLRGIQIQVRVTDSTNKRIKVLTIRQDFTDKL